MTAYPHSCPACGGAAYVGLVAVRCSNDRCTHAERPVIYSVPAPTVLGRAADGEVLRRNGTDFGWSQARLPLLSYNFPSTPTILHQVQQLVKALEAGNYDAWGPSSTLLHGPALTVIGRAAHHPGPTINIGPALLATYNKITFGKDRIVLQPATDHGEVFTGAEPPDEL